MKKSSFKLNVGAYGQGSTLEVDGTPLDRVTGLQLNVPALGPSQLVVHHAALPGSVEGEAIVRRVTELVSSAKPLRFGKEPALNLEAVAEAAQERFMRALEAGREAAHGWHTLDDGRVVYFMFTVEDPKETHETPDP